MIYLNFIQGFVIGMTLIVAIGPQNLFIIRQGLLKNYVFITCLICSISDTLLIILGISISTLIANISIFYFIGIKIIGGIWLILYGIIKIIKSIKHNYKLFDIQKKSIRPVIITTLILTFINPHVYLDTVILIGAISQNFENKMLFGLGAIFASFIFFFSLGYFSKLLGQILKNIKTWIWIDSTFGILMICYGLFFLITIY